MNANDAVDNKQHSVDIQTSIRLASLATNKTDVQQLKQYLGTYERSDTEDKRAKAVIDALDEALDDAPIYKEYGLEGVDLPDTQPNTQPNTQPAPKKSKKSKKSKPNELSDVQHSEQTKPKKTKPNPKKNNLLQALKGKTFNPTQNLPAEPKPTPTFSLVPLQTKKIDVKFINNLQSFTFTPCPPVKPVDVRLSNEFKTTIEKIVIPLYNHKVIEWCIKAIEDALCFDPFYTRGQNLYDKLKAAKQLKGAVLDKLKENLAKI